MCSFLEISSIWNNSISESFFVANKGVKRTSRAAEICTNIGQLARYKVSWPAVESTYNSKKYLSTFLFTLFVCLNIEAFECFGRTSIAHLFFHISSCCSKMDPTNKVIRSISSVEMSFGEISPFFWDWYWVKDSWVQELK